jgi:hypothetical protein
MPIESSLHSMSHHELARFRYVLWIRFNGYFRLVLITILHVQTGHLSFVSDKGIPKSSTTIVAPPESYPDAGLEASMLNPSTPLGSDIVHKPKLNKKEK